jgi:putative sporulation protein YyaC
MLNQLFAPKTSSPESRFSIYQSSSPRDMATQLRDLLQQTAINSQELIILCIGTDRSTGDALGPLTGSKLKSLLLYPHIYGTLEQPVHAVNLPSFLSFIRQSFTNPFIIAVDACLGKTESVGYVSLGRGPLKPGAAVNKDLPGVGDIYISGIVNVGGFMEHLVLQSTRLSLVVKMAETIAQGLAYSLDDSFI